MSTMPHLSRFASVIVIGAALLNVAHVQAGELSRLDLGGAWQVVQEGSSEAIPATVPGTIHTDLLAAGKIPDPFYRNNERAVQWVGETNWIYSRAFDVPPDLLARQTSPASLRGAGHAGHHPGEQRPASPRPTTCSAPTSSTSRSC